MWNGLVGRRRVGDNSCDVEMAEQLRWLVL